MIRPRPRDDRCVTCGHAPDCHEADWDGESLGACVCGCQQYVCWGKRAIDEEERLAELKGEA